MIGDFLYGLTPRDSAQPLIETYVVAWFASGTSISLDADLTVEKGYAWMVKNLSISISPSNPALVIGGGIQILPPGKANSFRLFSVRGSGVGNAATGNQELLTDPLPTEQGADRQFHDLLLPEGWSIRGNGAYTAAVAGNSVRVEMVALRIPRGNLQI